jgi:p-hydroxybenzoate 3-monooxygenase
MLQRSGVDCVLLERQTRSYVEQRQRAGIVEYRAARMFEEWGLADQVLKDAREEGTMEFRVDGVARVLEYSTFVDGQKGRACPQQVLVQRLIETFLVGGGDLRFESADVALHDLTGDRPRVTYRDADGVQHEIRSQYVAGCDGFHGVSRTAVPAEGSSLYTYDHGIGWLTLLSDTPPPRYPLMAVSQHGFAAQFARGPRASRFYLQCPPLDDLANWPDERVWEELRLRLGRDDLPTGLIKDKVVVEMRSFVHEPMSHGRLHLVGDAAHIITPMGGKGMNLALYDAEMLARALRAVIREGDDALLRDYSNQCLKRVWNYQEFSRWSTEMLHDSGDESTAGPFRRKLARSRLDRLFSSRFAAGTFAELMSGTG